MADSGPIDENSIKRAKGYADAMKRAEESLARQRAITKIIGSDLLGLDENAFFRNLTDGEYAAKTEVFKKAITDATIEARKEASKLDGTFSKMFENSKIGSKEFLGTLKRQGVDVEKLNGLFDKKGKLVGSISEVMQSLGPEAFHFEEKMKDILKPSGELLDDFDKSKETIQEINDGIEMTNDTLEKAKKSTFSLASGFNHVGQNILKGVIPKLKEFDNAIKEAQTKTGINFSENTTQMGLLTTETARFGMSIVETADLMGDLGSELRTTNFNVLKEAAGDLAAMKKATGLTAQETSKLAKEFMLFGQSAKDVAKFSEDVMNQARVYGVSGTEIMKDMANNMSKMRTMGFVGGEQSLARMALEAKRLGMSVDDIFNVAAKARNIEGAMEMAAELQLAGGSFAQIDPMQLLSAARKGPEELQKILSQMGSDIGSWDEENKKMVFDPIDVDRLQMVSSATGLQMDSLQNMIGKNAEDIRKVDLFGGIGGSLDGLDEKQRAFIMNATKIGEGGKLELTADVEGVSDVNDLAKMSSESINKLIDIEVEKKKSLEEQAQQNMSFEESFKALKDSFMNIFTVLQPALKFLTWAIQGLNNSFGGLGKYIAVGAVAFGAIVFSSARAIIQGMNMAKGFQLAMKGGSFFGGIKESFKNLNPFRKGAGGATGLPETPETPPGGEKSQGWISSFAEGISKFSKVEYTDILKLGLALTTIGAAVALFMYGMTLAGSPDGSQLITAAGALVIMAGGLFLATKILGDLNPNSLIKASISMILIGASLIPFAYAAQMMSEVDWLNVLAGIGVAMLFALGLMGLGFLMTYALPLILFGALGLLLAASTLAAAGYLLTLAIEPLERITEIDWTGLGGFAAAISAFGLGTVFAAVGLFAGAVALAASAPLLAMSVDPLTKIAQTDWSGMSSFADALFMLGPAMLAFGAAGLLLFNPLMLLGMTTMFGALGILGSIMQTLGPNLEQGASGIERMAEGVIKLEQAVSNLDTDKLSSLRNLAFSFATGGAGMGKMVAALSGGGGEGGSERKVVHVVKLELDGKMLKEIELRDNKHRV